jgi:hypothetical protein
MKSRLDTAASATSIGYLSDQAVLHGLGTVAKRTASTCRDCENVLHRAGSQHFLTSSAGTFCSPLLVHA